MSYFWGHGCSPKGTFKYNRVLSWKVNMYVKCNLFLAVRSIPKLKPPETMNNSWPFQLIIWLIIKTNIKLFSYLATCGWLFDGFFSHWQLAVESILQLANSSDSTIGRRIFGSGAGPRPPGWAAQGPSAASENPSTDRWIAWIRQLKDGFDGQLPMGEESIE